MKTTINYSVSQVQKHFIVKNAERHNLAINKYITACISHAEKKNINIDMTLNLYKKQKSADKYFKSLEKEVNKLGVNINQIAKVANHKRDINQNKVIEAYKETNNTLLNVYMKLVEIQEIINRS